MPYGEKCLFVANDWHMHVTALLKIAYALCDPGSKAMPLHQYGEAIAFSSCVHRVTQRSTAQHSTAQHSTAQHSTAQRSSPEP